MARSLAGFLVLVLAISICEAASIFQPISDSHRSAALVLFKPVDGSFASLEETYEALRTFEILGIIKKPDVSTAACGTMSKVLSSSSSTPKDLFVALRVNSILKCKINAEVFEGIISRLQAAVSGASSLLDFYYSIGSLGLIKDRTSNTDVHLSDAEGIFRSIKALSQSDGRWRYSSNNPESSTFAAGIALEALARIVSLASSEVDQSMIGTVKNDILKLFDSIEKYDDGAFYFDEKVVNVPEHSGPLSTSSSVVRGLTAFTTVASGSLNLPGDKILGLAKFFLGIGIPGDAKDFFNQIDSLACLESNRSVVCWAWIVVGFVLFAFGPPLGLSACVRVSIPLILSVPSTVVSLAKKENLMVKVNTVLGSKAPPLTVKLVRAYSTSSKDTSIIENKELSFDTERVVYFLDALPDSVDVGSYIFVFKVVLHDFEHKDVYITGTLTHVQIFMTGLIKIGNAEIAVLDNDLGSIETQRKLDLAGENAVSLPANHLQKLRLSFQLTTPRGSAFKPHQAFLKLRHETKVEHIFLVGNSGKKFEITLDFLGLVEKLFYLSGKYDIQLTVGDVVMENSLLSDIGYVELDLPEAPEKAPRPPPQAVDPYSRYGPKAEISHIFRAPEKRPPKELSLTFLGLILFPFIGFLIGLLRLGVNLKNFPTSSVPATFAILFHVGIAAVLLLYVLFWLKLDLFTTLKTLSFLGVFLMFVGHRILSHLASASSKLKSA
ncbi:hypothetical protein Ddye_016266 [Dipteronia dyeriana]|uniref:Dolichyl-diphosphooligosaccharide--protein glycosyltransferase subunit 2 n=1 Tax=Dipteronia dyeriana TaxID=168575 RepID=A0AAD9U7B5_9ROSI|nr:hypothetical protein Ddye_032647 [Dipteronia dyeriana]KAK2648777.1 hypothetical protein Ddye_016266 [Dipteronia dyeriana]